MLNRKVEDLSKYELLAIINTILGNVELMLKLVKEFHDAESPTGEMKPIEDFARWCIINDKIPKDNEKRETTSNTDTEG